MIKLEKISKKYGKSFAIKDIDLEFKHGETVAIIGPSGSGKSTLMRCINRLEEPTSGKVFINDEKLTSRNRHKLCLKIGMVFQHFNLFPHMNVRDNLIYGSTCVLGTSKADAEQEAAKLLAKFGLEDKLFERPANLSGGQKQRIAIARALMMHPELMLFDEPTSALDPEVIKDVIEAILLLKKQITMLIVTHHIKFARKVADRIIFMDQAMVLCDQPTDEFFVKPKSHRARLFLENIGDLL